MPILVHLADERDAANIRKNGIKIRRHGKGVYCMPVMQNFYISHQWLRELKRFGGNTFVGVYFKADSSEKVFAGKYNEPHRHITLGEAISEINNIDDPLGYELIIDRKIITKEIHAIRHLPQNVGWRYIPGSNGKKPCGCDYCQRSNIKAKSIRSRYGENPKQMLYDVIMEKLRVEEDEYEIEHLLCHLGAKRRNTDPVNLLFLIEKNSDLINYRLAWALKKFRHKNTKTILLQLLQKEDSDTKESATESLLYLYGKEVEEQLVTINNASVQSALIDWQKKNAAKNAAFKI